MSEWAWGLAVGLVLGMSVGFMIAVLLFDGMRDE